MTVAIAQKMKLCIKSSEAVVRRCSMKKYVLKNSSKFTGKQLCQSLFFNKVAGLRPATLLKKRLSHRCFPVNCPKFLRTRFLQNTAGRLLLEVFLVHVNKSWTENLIFRTFRSRLVDYMKFISKALDTNM